MTTIFNKGNTTKTMKVYSNKILIESQRLDEAQAVKPEKNTYVRYGCDFNILNYLLINLKAFYLTFFKKHCSFDNFFCI